MDALVTERHLASRRGFSLVEVMVAVFIGAAILVAATTFVFSMGELWGKGADERLFQKHVRGVSRFLEQALQTSAWRLPAQEGETPIYWSERGGVTYQNTQFLTFELEKSPGVLVWPEEPLPYVVCSLEFEEGEGLFLLWRSRLEADFGEEEPRRTLVSPFVKAFRYHYIEDFEEDEEWEVEEDPKREASGEYVLPQRMELVFEYQGREEIRQIPLPTVFAGVPLF